MRVLITGVSRGLGLGLANAHLDRGDQVLALGRTLAPTLQARDGLRFESLDLLDPSAYGPAVAALTRGCPSIDLVWLNAGVLGSVGDLRETPVADMERVMSVNVWANKILLDQLFEPGRPTIDEVIGISSGAAVNGNRGWGGYAISKAALNMLIQLESKEHEATRFYALAPGLVDTAMQEQLCGMEPDERFPSLDRLRAARGTVAMPDPDEAARRILDALPALRQLPSGSFADLRQLATKKAARLDPEGK
ncbi:MAG: SDR family NAD(P)-dependent oxidoreductase [Planctomycetes bacterium]|nr:SDR family NAD(P)-dependent oxidoreductase [Planctomycetota bacterium]